MRYAFGSAAMCLLALALPLAAHHSHGLYDDAFKDIQGVVTEVHLLVPHSFVYIEVKAAANAEAQLWALEGTSRTGLERAGVTKDYLKVGDVVKVRCHPLRDGTNGCLLGFLKIKGEVKDWDGGNLAAPADF